MFQFFFSVIYTVDWSDLGNYNATVRRVLEQAIQLWGDTVLGLFPQQEGYDFMMNEYCFKTRSWIGQRALVDKLGLHFKKMCEPTF